MRGRIKLGLMAAAMAVGAGAPALAVAAQPCLSATDACVQWVALGKSGARSMVYSTYSLTRPDAHIKRALIMVHGALRNADHYFTTATGAAFLAKALDDTIVIAPALHSAQGQCKDKLAPHEVSWSCGGDSWRSGGKAASDPELTSFDFVDEILRRVADKKTFPNMKAIVVAGHSAGGQFVSRYEMANKAHETLGAPVSYVVANPSSYAWPDASRPLPEGDGAPAAAVKGWESETVHTNFSYGPFAEVAKAPKYDLWPYGFEQRTGYVATESEAQLKRQLAGRPTTYLLSQVDTLPLGGFDGSANAMAQGATRRARGEAFVKFLNEHLGGHAKAMIVPECGHNDRCVYTTDEVLKVIFPEV
ncbi:alpha/beta hydrolase [Phenylobacterium sp.]|jgi:pimeloyl-ACP methyl ester carboxylesterase|uniref:alpha/beta hydrolase n=1 Tax=Phenylobacterium sp. TaxID=1871053 RepID=UPI002F3E7BCC